MEIWLSVHTPSEADRNTDRNAYETGYENADEGTELTRALADWLAEDREVGIHAEIRRVRGDDPGSRGAMGADPMAWVQLITGSGFSVAGLIYAHQAFRASLPRRLQSAPVVIECDGTRIIVEDGSPETAARIALALGAGAGHRPDGDEPHQDPAPHPHPHPCPAADEESGPEGASGAAS